MQISIDLSKLRFEVYDGVAVLSEIESANLAKVVLSAIEKDLTEDAYASVFALLEDFDSLANAASVAASLRDLKRAVVDRELTGGEIDLLGKYATSPFAWVKNCALGILRDDASARDEWLDEVESRGPTESDRIALVSVRHHHRDEMRVSQACNLLVKLATR